MAAGQALDILGVNSLSALLDMYALKTGALFATSVKLGMIAANAKENTALDKFAGYIGLAFQIQDDLLDFVSDPAITGKPIGLDAANKKITYPSLLGIEKAQEKIQEFLTKALLELTVLGDKADLLRSLIQFILCEKNRVAQSLATL